MAGQGQGMLQPTKLILSDDFHDNLGLPGYQSYTWTVGSDLAESLYIIPDGITAEVMDFGFTVSDVLGTANVTTLVLNKVLNGTTTALTNAATWATTDAAGATKSALRGDITYTAAADTAAERQLGPGVELKVAATKGSAAAGIASIWVRLKFVSKDFGAI